MPKCRGFHPSPQTGQDGPKPSLFTNSPMVTIDPQICRQNSIHQNQGPANNRHKCSLANQNQSKCYDSNRVGDPECMMGCNLSRLWSEFKPQTNLTLKRAHKTIALLEKVCTLMFSWECSVFHERSDRTVTELNNKKTTSAVQGGSKDVLYSSCLNNLLFYTYCHLLTELK